MRALCQFLDRPKYIFICSLAKFTKGKRKRKTIKVKNIVTMERIVFVS